MKLVLSGCLLALSAASVNGCHGGEPAAPTAPQTAQAHVVESRRQQVALTVSATGSVRARETAIVSAQVGAKAMIEQFPGSGWIIEPDEDALYRCVKAHIQNRASLFSARTSALEAAQHFTWQAYRDRVGVFIENWIKE